jgi:two-component system chemotaxis response regulator CheY
MDLTEYYVSYFNGVAAQMGTFQRCIVQLKDVPEDRSALNTAARAVHSIKGSSWTIRDVPLLLNDEPADTDFDTIASIAERLESHLGAVFTGQETLAYSFLYDGVVELEDAIHRQRGQHLTLSPQMRLNQDGQQMTGQVLIVDDDEVYRKMMVRYFERIGIEAVAAQSGEEGLAILHAESSPIALILLDLAMPYLNGFDFARMVRAESKFADLTLVAVTARKGMDVDAEARDAGINRVITKPPEPSVIRSLCVELGLIEEPQ